MKKLLGLFFVLATYYSTLWSQTYQLPNGGFEEWETVTYSGRTGDEPLHWNSFITCSGSFASASANQIYESTDVRPGSTGTKSIKTTARNVMFGIIANGTFTTGQVNMGSYSVTNPANHNITHTANPDFNQPLNAKPDTMVFWAKFVCPSATQQARMSAVIHDDYDYMDPDSYAPEAPQHKVGAAVLNFTSGDGEWHRYAVPFDYNFPATSPEYILITFSTNAVAGEGSTSDALYVDDIEMIYNALLSDLKVNGATIEGFAAGNFNYQLTMSGDEGVPEISATAASPNANVTITQATPEQPVATVSVTHGDQTYVYTISFELIYNTSLSDLQVNGTTIEGFDADVFEYQLTLDCDAEIPQISATAATASATVNIVQATVNQPVATVSVTSGNQTSVYTVAMTIRSSYSTETAISICESQLPFLFEGQEFNEAGTYPVVLTSSQGCDSTITLILTVGDEYAETLATDICEGETWSFMDETYSETGVYEVVIHSPEGCDSVFTIIINVHQPEEIFLVDTIYQGDTYTLNGFDIPAQEELGTFDYQLVMETTFGCDSVVNLALTVLDKSAISELEATMQVLVYPNPTRDFITIKSSLPLQNAAIFDLNGRLVKRINGAETTISVQDLNSGYYLLKMQTSAGVAVRKLLIQ